ncbi:MAG TPA: aldose 1-epimerase family protein [Rubrobacter sp.]
MDLYDKALARQQLYQRVGRLEQVAGIQPFVFDDGPARGVSALRLRTGGSLSLDVLCDRGMDLGAAEYRGAPLAWASPTGVVAPHFRELQGEGWLRSFGGGLLVTCGLQNVGEPSVRNGEELGLHGRISNTPAALLAREVRWEGEDCLLQARAEVRESKVFGADLVLTRTISARIGEPRVQIEDTVRNEGYRPEPLMLLYHINLGWPVLDETARLVGPGAPGELPEPRDAEAQKGLKHWDSFASPTPGFRERVFYHRPRADAQGWAEARLENPSLEGGIALSVRFRPEQLPQFVQWTMTGEGTYVVGLEPATCRVGGYQREEAEGRVIHLAPGESRRFRLQIEISPMPR